MNKRKKRKWSTFFLLLFFFVGLSVMLYPTISNYWNSKTQSEAIVDYEKMLAAIAPEDYSKIFEAADNYNKDLASLDFPFLEYKSLEGYNEILDLTGYLDRKVISRYRGYHIYTADSIHKIFPICLNVISDRRDDTCTSNYNSPIHIWFGFSF